MELKKWTSIFLTAAMVMSVIPNSESVVYASEFSADLEEETEQEMGGDFNEEQIKYLPAERTEERDIPEKQEPDVSGELLEDPELSEESGETGETENNDIVEIIESVKESEEETEISGNTEEGEVIESPVEGWIEDSQTEEEVEKKEEKSFLEEEILVETEDLPVEDEQDNVEEDILGEVSVDKSDDIMTEEKLENETVQAEADGWHKENGKWYYVESGEKVTEDWRRIGNYMYYFGDDGIMYADRDEYLRGYDHREIKSYYRFDQDGHMVTGWYETGRYESERMVWYYYDSDGRAVSGIQKIGNSTYYFSSDGRMCIRDVVTENGIMYRFGADGKLTDMIDTTKNGWEKTADGNYLYLEFGEPVQQDWRKIDGYWYYFDRDGLMVKDTKETIEDAGGYVNYRFDQNGHIYTGWYQEEGEWYYYDNNGTVRGLKKINGVLYLFSAGKMETDTYYKDKDGKNVYYFGSDGKMAGHINAFSDGWKKIGDDWFYVKSGRFLENEWLSEGGYWYYFEGNNGKMCADYEYRTYRLSGSVPYIKELYRFDEKGHMIKGWDQKDGVWYYFTGTGSGAALGLQKINGKTYYFNPHNGQMQVSGSVSIDGVLYMYGPDGVCSQVSGNGWFNNRFYVENGKVVTGWKKLYGKWYYFDSSTGEKRRNGHYTIDGKSYSFRTDGVMETGWIRETQQGRRIWRYAEESGELVRSTWKKIGSAWYYFESYGGMATGVRTIDGRTEVFRNDGIWIGSAINDGWYRGDSGDWYYLEDGQPVVSQSGKWINGKLYRFDLHGRMITGWDQNSYFGSDGAAAINQWKKDYTGQWCYFKADGNSVYEGWKKIDSSWYYFEDGHLVTEDKVIGGALYRFAKSGASDRKGTLVKDGWNLVNGHYYYYKDGTYLYGFQTIGKDCYYFDSDGRMEYQSLVHENGKGYHLADKSGRLVVNAWCKVDDIYYYAGADGIVVKGLQTIGGKKYFFSKSGGMCESDTISEDARTLYVINKNGVVTDTVKAGSAGWKKSGGCYFYSKNGKFVTGYQVIGGKGYYFYPSGVMASNQMVDHYGYADKNGQIHTDGWYGNDHMIYVRNGQTLDSFETVNGKNYAFDKGVACSRLFSVDGKYYNYNSSKGTRTTAKLKEGWNKVSNEWYYFRNGSIQTGNCEVDGKFYHFNKEGVMLRNCLYHYSREDRRVQYLGDNGLAVKNCWMQLENAEYENGKKEWYYFDSNGFAVTGIQKVNGKTYTFGKDGRML